MFLPDMKKTLGQVIDGPGVPLPKHHIFNELHDL